MRSAAGLGFCSSGLGFSGEPPPESFDPPPDTVVDDKGDELEVDVGPGFPTSTSRSLVGLSWEPSFTACFKRAALPTAFMILWASSKVFFAQAKCSPCHVLHAMPYLLNGLIGSLKPFQERLHRGDGFGSIRCGYSSQPGRALSASCICSRFLFLSRCFSESLSSTGVTTWAKLT